MVRRGCIVDRDVFVLWAACALVDRDGIVLWGCMRLCAQQEVRPSHLLSPQLHSRKLSDGMGRTAQNFCLELTQLAHRERRTPAT